MRLAMYAGASTVLATGVILRAIHERANFYSACVYLAQSNACLMILTNLALLGVAGFMIGLQRLFFGTLRPIEVEQLYEKAWFAITETCLAMTIFREEVGAYFLVMFVSLLIGKVWGWIGEGRVEILEQQPPANPRLFHLRLSSSLLISTFFDLYMLLYSVSTVLQQARPNMMVVFAFEFAVLHVTSVSTAARYTVSLYEASVIKNQTKLRREQIRHERSQERARARQDAAPSDGQEPATSSSTDTSTEDDVDSLEIEVPGWEGKGRWMFYLDLATDFCKLVLYLTFFFVLCMFYGMPIHIIRDVALTIRSFYKRINDFVKYRQATRDMNERYPDATPEEVAREDVCIICRDSMRAWTHQAPNQNPPAENGQPPPPPTALDEQARPKKLPCGHVLHFSCLRSWLERQQNCPICRRSVLVTEPPTSSGSNPPNQNGGAAPAPNQQQAPPAPGHRPPVVHQNVFNLGPFRLAFGARIGHGPPPQVDNNPAAPNQPQIPGGPAFGNPFNFFGQPQAQQQTNARFTPVNITAQLQQIEQQLMREVNSLRIQSDQLYQVRALQGELARLRIQQAQANLPPMLYQARHPHIMNNGFPTGGTQGHLAHLPSVFSSQPQQQSMTSGHPDLPPGMTLPEGWTVLPLQRVAPAGSTAVDVPTASSSSQPAQPQEPASSSGPQAGTVTSTETSAPNIPPSNENHNSMQPSTQTTSSQLPSSDPAASEPSAPAPASSTPQTPDIPQWGSAPPPTKVEDPATNTPETEAAEPTPISMNGTTIHPSSVPAEASEPSQTDRERREAKGKGKAVTVEDLNEDVD